MLTIQDVNAKIREYELKGWKIEDTNTSNPYDIISPEGDVFCYNGLKQLLKRVGEAKELAQLLEKRDMFSCCLTPKKSLR